VILYELLCGVPLANVHPEGITSHTILKLPDHLSQEAKHILKHVSTTSFLILPGHLALLFNRLPKPCLSDKSLELCDKLILKVGAQHD